jgi:hypothetical protein
VNFFVSGNNAPSVRGFIEYFDRAGIKFRYTKMSGEQKVRRLADLFAPQQLQGNLSLILACLEEIYSEIFSVWSNSAHTELFDLFAYYFDGYSVANCTNLRLSYVHQDPAYLKSFINYCLNSPGTAPARHYKLDPLFYTYKPCNSLRISLPGVQNFSVLNLGLLFSPNSAVNYLRSLPPQRLYSSFSHGDANLANFLLDGRNNVWVIDYSFTAPGHHTLRDISKTFTNIMYTAAEINNDSQFNDCALITQEIMRKTDLNSALEPISALSDPNLRTIYTILARLWSLCGPCVKERSSSTQFLLALAGDSMRFFLYRCRNIYSKRWALLTASALIEAVIKQEKRVHNIAPSWVEDSEITIIKGKLGLTRCPGNRNYTRYQPNLTESAQDSNSGAAAEKLSNLAQSPTWDREEVERKERLQVKEQQAALRVQLRAEKGENSQSQGSQLLSDSQLNNENYEDEGAVQETLRQLGLDDDLQAEAAELQAKLSLGSNIPAAHHSNSRVYSELFRLKSEGVSHLMFLITDSEYREMGVDKELLFSSCNKLEMKFISVAMPSGIMQLDLLVNLVSASLAILCDEACHRLVLVGKGGFHRAGTVAACILVAFGLTPAAAIKLIRDIRGAAAIGRDAREKLITKFDVTWKSHLIHHLVKSGGLINEKNDKNNTISTAKQQFMFH